MGWILTDHPKSEDVSHQKEKNKKPRAFLTIYLPSFYIFMSKWESEVFTGMLSCTSNQINCIVEFGVKLESRALPAPHIVQNVEVIGHKFYPMDRGIDHSTAPPNFHENHLSMKLIKVISIHRLDRFYVHRIIWYHIARTLRK